jgi:hypothetical protein
VTVPPEAITAAAAAILIDQSEAVHLATMALSAAAPLIAAAERERIRQLALTECAWYGADPGCVESDCPHCDARSFADLLTDPERTTQP